MEHHYAKIKERYDAFQRHLLANGKFLARDTGIGYWGVTPLPELFEFFKRFNLGQHRRFIDLGSGDGRVVLLASVFGLQAHGIEYDQWLSNTSLVMRRKISLPHFEQTKLLHGDFMSLDLSQYDVLFTHPDKPFFRDSFESKLAKELRGRLIVHGWEFHPLHLSKSEEHIINGEKFCVFDASR